MALSLKGGINLFGGADGEIEIDGRNVMPIMPVVSASIHKNYNTTTTNDFIAVQSVSSPADFETIGYQIRVAIHNRSGADDTYDWTIQNFTKSLNLISATAVAIVNRAQREWYFVAGIDKISEGDFILFSCTDGVLGTGGAEIANGTLEIDLIPMVKIKPIAELQGIREI